MRQGALVAALGAVKLIVHLGLSGRFGYHGDELYFIACGKRLAWGYVDHPPLVPWITRLVSELLGPTLFGLRLVPAVAGTLALWLTVLITRRLGGGLFAQLIAGLAVLIAPAYLRMGSILCIPAVGLVFWTLGAYLVVRVLQGGTPRLWLLVGLVAGVGLLTKHTMLFWGLGLVVGLLLTPERRRLRQIWPWAGGGVALAVFMPNLIWQAQHDWATAQFIRNISAGMLAEIPRSLFLLGQLVYMHPFLLPVWVAGLVFLFSRKGERYRPLGWSWVVVLATLLITRGKPYYLAPAYPALFAGGAVWIEELAGRRGWRKARVAFATTLAAGGIGFGVMALPVLPLATSDRILGRLFAFAIDDPALLTGEFHEQYGWEEQTATIAAVFNRLPPADRRRTTILTRSYNQAAAVEFFGPRYGLPGAVSGHETYYLWGPGPGSAEVVVAYALPPAQLRELFHEVTEVARSWHPLAPAYNNDLPVFVCRRSRIPLREAWPRLRRYENSFPPPM